MHSSFAHVLDSGRKKPCSNFKFPSFAENDGQLVENILCYLSEADLGRLARCSRSLRAYAIADRHWRHFSLLGRDLESLPFSSSNDWYGLFLTANGHSRRNPLAENLPFSDYLTQLLALSTWRAQNSHPHHLTLDALAHAAAEGSAGVSSAIDFTWMSTPGIVPYVDAHTLSVERFRSEFEAPGRPAVICGLASHWPAMHKWQPDALAASLGDSVTFSVAHRVGAPYGAELALRMSLPAYLRYARSPLAARDELPLYIFDSSFGELAPQLLSHYDVPSLRLFPEDMMSGLGRQMRPAFRWLVIGGPRSGTPWHWDPHGTSAWNVLLAGTKRWFLYPPGFDVPGVFTERDAGGRPVSFASPMSPSQWFLEVFPHLPLQQRPLEFLQRASDTVFIPSGWWHMVINVSETETVSVTQNYVSALSPDQPTFVSGGCLSALALGPGPVFAGNVLEVVTDFAAQSASAARSIGSATTDPAAGANDNLSTLADDAKQGKTGGLMSASSRRSRMPVGPDPDAHGLAHAPSCGIDVAHLRSMLPQEALRAAAQATAAPNARYRALLDNAFSLSKWHLCELLSLRSGAVAALEQANTAGGTEGSVSAMLAPFDTASAFTSHAHLLASFACCPLYAGLVAAALDHAHGTAGLTVSLAAGACNLQPLTSRTNPTFAVSDLASGAPVAVVKLFAPFVCEDGGRQFQPASTLAAWQAEVAVLSETTDGVCKPQIFAHGLARQPSGSVIDGFSPSVFSPRDHCWKPVSVPVDASGNWCWPFIVTRFIPRDGNDEATSWADARASAEESDTVSLERTPLDVACGLGALVARFHCGDLGTGPSCVAAQLVAIHSGDLEAVRGAFGRSTDDASPADGTIDIPFPAWVHDGTAPGSVPLGVRLPRAWAPYYARLLTLRLSAEARRERTRSLPLHLLQQVGSFLPPLHQVHVLLPLQVHPAHLTVSADGYIDLSAPGVLPPPVLLHGDLTSSNVFGRRARGGSGSRAHEGGGSGSRTPPASWTPSTLIDFGDACVGDALWDVPAAACSLLDASAPALTRFLASYDSAVDALCAAPTAAAAAPSTRSPSTSPAPARPARLTGDASLGYRLVCLLLLHPVDGSQLLLQRHCAPPPQASRGRLRGGIHRGGERLRAGSVADHDHDDDSDAESGDTDLLGGMSGMPLTWADVAMGLLAASSCAP